MRIKNKFNDFFKIFFIILVIIYIMKLYFFNNYCLNISPSIPKGIYKLKKIEEYEKGKIVYIKIPDNAKNIIWNREYLPKHIKYLVKYIKGVPGDHIQIKNNKLYINNIFKGNIKEADLQGKKLNSELPKDYVLKKEEYLLLGANDDSYDSRYFGIIKKEKILKEAVKVEFNN